MFDKIDFCPECNAPLVLFRPPQRKAFRDIYLERNEQDKKWGEQNHRPEWWLAILGEEFGELCQTVLHRNFGGPEAQNLRDELVQVAAVAVAMIECCDRNEWYLTKGDS